MTRISSGNFYPGGTKPLEAAACYPGDFFEKARVVCIDR
jgi:hypothetical protein